MDERIYLSLIVPYGELTHGVADPRGERLAPGSLRHAKGSPPRLYLQHAGDRSHYRIPAGRLWEAGDDPAGLHLVFELHRTAEGRRAAENAADSTQSVSPELIVYRRPDRPPRRTAHHRSRPARRRAVRRPRLPGRQGDRHPDRHRTPHRPP